MIDTKILRNTAEELNSVLGLVPVINLAYSAKDLQIAISKVSTLITSKDHFSDETITCLLNVDMLTEDVAAAFSIMVSCDVDTVPKTKLGRPSKKDVGDIPKSKRKRNKKPHIVRIEELISEHSHTAKEIVAVVFSEFDVKESTITNYVSCAKNPKYNIFTRDVIEHTDTKVLGFK